MDTHVNFETAKLLKEKGFDEINNKLWHFNSSDCIEMVNKNSENFGFSAPTIAEVVMWLYEKHGIWVEVNLTDNSRDYYFDYTIVTSKNRDFNDEDCFDSAGRIYSDENYGSPTEAYQEAINYTLKNLIK